MKPQNVLIFISILSHCCYTTLVFSSPQNDASALLDFKSKSDLHTNLNYSNKTLHHFCKWEGVTCSINSTTVIKLVIEGKNLGGIFAPNTLTRLTQIRVLSLQNNSLTGPIPNLSGLPNLKVLFLSHNYFSESIPPSISTLHRLKTLDLSNNMLTGPIPVYLNRLDRLSCLRLDFNRFNGSLPPFNLTSLQIFNVSHNDLIGAIPVTPTLARFNSTSFELNRKLCGEIIHKQCRTNKPFFGATTAAAAAPPPPVIVLSQTAPFQGGAISRKRKREGFVIGFSIGACVFVVSIVFLAVAKMKRKGGGITKMGLDPSVTGNAEAVMRIEEENDELEEKIMRVQEGKQQQLQMVGKSGSLVFCAGETQVYTLDQLMRASAQLLGRGTMGTTYKAVLDSRLIVTVKRLDGGRLAGASQEFFEGHMESVGGLRHPNLVPLRAYFQAKEERLLVYDYQPNGSLFSLIHGSKSARAKPLHWTSCLKIAEDVGQGLSYIHQAWRLIHGNLKSSNILLGSDFEACLTDYCLAALASPTPDDDSDSDSIACKAPEIRKFNHHEATSKCDVYSFGILLLELLTGKHPSQIPNLSLDDMVNWMRSVREEGSGENRLAMLVEVAMACSVAVPEQRPTMWEVLKMIQEIKEVVLTEGGEFLQDPGTS